MSHTGKRLSFLCLALSAAVLCAAKAEAHHRVQHVSRLAHATKAKHRHVIQCVGYVHLSTDFKIHGNAKDWWPRAAGLYARGNKPEVGSILSFRPTHRMPLGHVAVVRRQVDSRTIYIDQSHWAADGISYNVRVVDVSPANNWTAVRVALNGDRTRLGSIYPTNGFIYHRPEGSLPPLTTGPRNILAAGSSSDMETASISMDDDIFGDEAPSRALQ